MSHKSAKEGKKAKTERIKELEEELSKTKYNKRTQHHIGLVKAKIARLKEAEEKKASGKGGGQGYAVKKTGDATVIMVGYPSVGKSTLLNKLTNAKSPIGSYDFTTLDVIPGLLEHNNAKIQILDVPGLVSGAASGKGRGKEVLGVIRNADLIIIIVDGLKPKQCEAVKKEIVDSNVRINQEKPDVRITKKAKGGIQVGTTVKLKWMDEQTIKDMLKEMRIPNADVLIRTDITQDQLIDVVEGNRSYIPALIVVNKTDLLSADQVRRIKKMLNPDLMVSADKGKGINDIKEKIYEKLRLINIFLKEVNKKPDMEEPMIMHKGCTIGDICRKIHKDFIKKFRFARVWGKSAKFPGQEFRKLDKTLEDGDIVEIHIR